MIRNTVLIFALSTTSVYAQDASTPTAETPASAGATAEGGAAAAAAEAGVTGFVPLVAPAVGVLAAAAGLAAAGGGGSSTTSTVNTD